jgi:GNAT superfamily N-acetyltransferase
MQRHYGQPVSDAVADAAAAFACRSASPAGFDPRILVAVTGAGPVIGAVVLNVTFPASELSQSLYIRDLYIAATARRRGVARSLLRAAAKLTLAQGFSALDWTADAKNTRAHQLYESVGAIQVGRVYFRLAGAGLRGAAELPQSAAELLTVSAKAEAVG